MFRGLYAAATAMNAAQQKHEQTTANLAHLNQTGYRAKGVVLETFDRAIGHDTPPTGDLNGTRLSKVYYDFQTGPIEHTGNPFDLALENDAYFSLLTPEGRVVHTRAGSFRLTAQGRLVNPSGYSLQGDDGLPVTVPLGNTYTIGTDGTITVDGAAVGRIRLVRFGRPDRLEQVGPTLFRATNGVELQQVEQGVQQGYREGSNVKPANAMIELISESRYFEASQRALRTIAEAVQLNTRPQ
ncbi:MAG: flagellar hook-basal body protein [Gemmataceae bacterium]|nr:flagellar hook-basal body protein [Gemmataceae bacterium]